MLIFCSCGLKKEVLVGELSDRIAHLDFQEEVEPYFQGIELHPKKKAKDFHYEAGKKIQLTKKEFYERIKSFREIF